VDVNLIVRVATVAFYLTTSVTLCAAQASRLNYEAVGHQSASKARDSFLDFTLKRMNPDDTDYGKCLGEGRRILLDETVKNGYFWSNLSALGVLACLLIIIVSQHRVHTKREWTMSEILTQYEQTLARANGQIEEATRRNHSLTESLAALKQSSPVPQAPPAEKVDRAPYRPVPSQVASVPSHTRAAPRADNGRTATVRPATTAVPASPSGQIALFKPEVELVTKVNALEQQLGRSHEVEKQLRRQLNETGRKLQAEQDKNRGPKGE
jgi:hypothetical protein